MVLMFARRLMRVLFEGGGGADTIGGVRVVE